MQLRLPERFVRVEIPHASQKGLIKQQRLDARFAATQFGSQNGVIQVGQRIRSETLRDELSELVVRAEEVHAAKFARVDEPKLIAVVEAQDQVRVQRQRRLSRLPQQVPAHFAVDRHP